jgi:NADPH-dependent curcumin reductase CurA
MKSREWRLVSRPEGLPADDDFELVEVDLPAPTVGEVTVRNRYLSVDPYMRGRMRDVESYSPPYELGVVMHGAAVGEVVASEDAGFTPGDLVTSQAAWREGFTTSGDALTKLPEAGEHPSYYLGVLGMPGLTAYAGTLDVGRIAEGETFFVSGAAGAVGSVAGQVARLHGCRVIGSAGSDQKVAWLIDELGFDAAFNYHTSDLDAALAEAAPDGVDVYFDNVGYDHLQAALERMNPNGRVAACGSISGYNATDPRPGPSNLSTIVGKRITIQGFIVSDFVERRPQFLADMRRWLGEGELRTRETFVDGIEHAVEAFRGLFNGSNAGKMVVRLDP